MSFDLAERPFRLTPEEFSALPVGEVQLQRRQGIRELAAAMFAVNLDGTGFEKITQGHTKAEAVLHFSPGLYMRELHMAAGLRVVGMRHRQEHMNLILAGSATVFTEDGQEEVTAPAIFKGAAGTQRVVIVHEDMIWVTVHRCDEIDPQKAFEFVFMDETALIASRVAELEVAS